MTFSHRPLRMTCAVCLTVACRRKSFSRNALRTVFFLFLLRMILMMIWRYVASSVRHLCCRTLYGLLSCGHCRLFCCLPLYYAFSAFKVLIYLAHANLLSLLCHVELVETSATSVQFEYISYRSLLQHRRISAHIEMRSERSLARCLP